MTLRPKRRRRARPPRRRAANKAVDSPDPPSPTSHPHLVAFPSLHTYSLRQGLLAPALILTTSALASAAQLGLLAVVAAGSTALASTTNKNTTDSSSDNKSSTDPSAPTQAFAVPLGPTGPLPPPTTSSDTTDPDMFRKLSKLGGGSSSSKKEDVPSSSTGASPAVAPVQEELNKTDAALDPTTGAHPAVLDEAREIDDERSVPAINTGAESTGEAPISPAIIEPTLVSSSNESAQERREDEHEHRSEEHQQELHHAGALRVDSSPVTPYDGPVKDDGMMAGFVPVPVSPSGGAHDYPAEKTGEHETAVPATTAGVQDDGMMHNFVPVPTHVPSHSQEKEVEQPTPTAAETVVERLPSDEERERLSASQGTALGAAGGAGLAGVGAFAAHQHHSPATTETATFDHALPPATTVTPGLLHHHQTVTEGGSIDQTRPSAIDGHPIPVDGAGAPVPVPASVAGLARGGAVGGGTGSISRRDLKKIEKAEHKDNKSLAKIMKSEAKHEAAVLEAAIKELARMQTTVKDSAKLEAKSARSRDEMIKIEQRTNAKFLEVKAVHDKAVAELRAKEEEHEINQRQTETATNQVAEQTRKIEELRAAKARDDRERAEKLAAMK